MKICPTCGKENIDTAKYCNECGAEIVVKEQEKDVAPDEDINSSIDEESRESDQEQNSKFDNQGAKLSPKDEKKTRNYLIFVIAAAIVLCFIVFFATHTKNNKRKYYVEPRKDYAITDPDFDFLDKDTKEKIAVLLQKNIEWFNSIEYDEEKEIISSEDVVLEDVIKSWNALADDKENLINRKRLLAISPAMDGFSDFSTCINDCSFEKNENGGANYIINVSSDEWMHLHNKLQEAINFYYEDGDHFEMNDEPETNYHVLTDSDEEDIRAKMVVQLLQANPILSNGDWHIDITQEKDGTVVIEHVTKAIITKQEWVNNSDLQKDYTVKLGEIYIDTFLPVVDEYEGYYKDISLISRIVDSNDITLVEIDKEKNTIYRAD